MKNYIPGKTNSLWHKAPFLRLFPPFIAGIIVEKSLSIPFLYLLIGLSGCCLLIIYYSFLSLKNKFRLRFLSGIFICLIISLTGALLIHVNDIRNKKNWFEHYYNKEGYLIVTIAEPLIEKANSYKALATVNKIYSQDSIFNVSGSIIIYFKKEGSKPLISYGSKLILKTQPAPITNTGNPGCFNFKEYCLFPGITARAFLRQNDYYLLQDGQTNTFQSFIYRLRDAIVNIICAKICGHKESGMAEALLIGYKDDLDKTLVQSYTDTGVIHIIAISGMHLGLI